MSDAAAANIVRRNLEDVRAKMAEAAHRAGRKTGEIRLIAISKTQPLAAVEAALAAGQTAFGENTIQEALTKIPALAGRDIEWHFIGHLQSNKAKFIPDNFGWIHSLDGSKLAARLSRLATEKGATLQCLIEVNITRDPAKHGLAPEALLPALDEMLATPLPGLRLRGLMAMGPYPATEADMRAAFARVRALRDQCQARFGLADFTELSMGMSGDYVEAILEGSTMVRVGTAIFGERLYAE